MLWEHEVAGSNPVAPTSDGPGKRTALIGQKVLRVVLQIPRLRNSVCRMKTKLALLLGTLLLGCSPKPAARVPGVPAQETVEAATAVYKNGKIYTVDSAHPWAEAVAVKDGRLIAVTTDKEIGRYIGESTKVIDLKGRFVMPGINDLHHHGGDVSLTAVDPARLALPESALETPETIVAAIKVFADAHPELKVIFVEGYPDGMFEGNNGPKELLDQVDKKRPVLVLALGGHSIWGNSVALKVAEVTAKTRDPLYGVIGRKKDSDEPNGTLHESAMGLYWRLVDMPSTENIKAGYVHHTKRINSLGITAVRIAGITQDVLEIVSSMDKEGELNAYHSLAFHWRTSYIAQMAQDYDKIKKQILNSKSFETENVASMALKYYADGAPASKTAYLLKDYENDPGNRGKLQMEEKTFDEEFQFWNKNGVTIMTHVVGDGASRAVLDAVEAAQKSDGDNGLRHHLSHSVMVDPADRPRLAQLGMVVDLSPAVAAPMAFHSAYKHHFGTERHEQFFPGRGLIDAGAKLMVASDFPVGPDNPWMNIETWTTRMNAMGEEPGKLGAGNAITLEEALEAATLSGAYGLYMEEEFGSLEVGKRATFLVLDRNPFEIPPADLSEIQVEQTYFNGRLVHERQN